MVIGTLFIPIYSKKEDGYEFSLEILYNITCFELKKMVFRR